MYTAVYEYSLEEIRNSCSLHPNRLIYNHIIFNHNRLTLIRGAHGCADVGAQVAHAEERARLRLADQHVVAGQRQRPQLCGLQLLRLSNGWQGLESYEKITK